VYAVRVLFEDLIYKGYARTNLSLTDRYWKDDLPEKYHLFGGRPVRFYHENFCVCVKLCLPDNSHVFFKQEEYGKRLIGNAFSIPVVEILLRELSTKFAQQNYTNYKYPYKWSVSEVEVNQEDTPFVPEFEVNQEDISSAPEVPVEGNQKDTMLEQGVNSEDVSQVHAVAIKQE
jgi:hypothetical protein